MLHVVHLGASLDERTDSLNWPLDGLGDLVDILWLNDSLQVILQDLGKVV